MKIGKTKVVEVEAKVLKLHLKVSDCFDAQLVDQNGEVVKEYEGYVPKFMPGEHYGDYVILDIDVDTGKILNWKVPTAEQLQNFMDSGNEE